MPQKTNCSKVHSERPEAGPCVKCHEFAVDTRYVHLCQKGPGGPFYNYVKQMYGFDDKACICRSCEMVLKRKSEEEVNVGGKRRKSDQGQAESTLATDTQAAEANSSSVSPNICSVCDKIGNKRSIRILPEKRTLLQIHIERNLKLEKTITSIEVFVCTQCYNSFNSFDRSEESVIEYSKTDEYLQKILSDINRLDEGLVNNNNLEEFCYNFILEYVLKEFLSNRALLMPRVYAKYDKFVDSTIKNLSTTTLSHNMGEHLKHDSRWLLRKLKSSLGHALLDYLPSSKTKLGIMLYRNGSDLLEVLHASLSENCQISEMSRQQEELLKKVTSYSKKSSTDDTFTHLENALKSVRACVKSFVSSNISSDSIPDIHSFDLSQEMQKIDPILWNFIYRLTATEQENKALTAQFRWDKMYFGSTFINLRLFPRLFIASCIFNTCNPQCLPPLHLLITDIADRYSSSSTDFLSINARLGVGLSKDTLTRFVTSRCKALQDINSFISVKSFAVASFDNLDKNSAYAVVTQGKDRSGFHGTTIQATFPKIREENQPCEYVHSEAQSTSTTEVSTAAEHSYSCSTEASNQTSLSEFGLCSSNQSPSLSRSVKKSSDRSLPLQTIKSFKEPEDKIGEPSAHQGNRFAHLTLKDFDETEGETLAWETFVSKVNTFGFLKHFAHEKELCFPSLKTYLSHPVAEKTEKSIFHFIAVLDETADSKETVLKTLNILHSKFQVGSNLRYLVVVGDGKSYDHLIRLKSEYGSSLNWVLPYPGDWHILKNLLSVFMKIFFDAGLKELAIKYHKGQCLKALVECTRFTMSHRFLYHVWEAMFRLQIESFFKFENFNAVDCKQQFEEVFLAVLTDVDRFHGDSFCSWEGICSKKELLEESVGGLTDAFNSWRLQCISASETFKFWDTFIHTDFMSYLGLFIAIRSRNWNLRNSALKHLACLFHAFDRNNYLRMIPYHFADLTTFPSAVVDHFHSGCFVASISGGPFHSVALDEAHEMEINLKTKKAINTFSPASLSTVTTYLPYRAEVLHNIKNQLGLNKEESDRRNEVSMSFIKEDERTVLEYVKKIRDSSLFKSKILDFDKSLIHIFTLVEASAVQTESLMNYRQFGTEDLTRYITCFLLRVSNLSVKPPQRKRRNLNTFSAKKTTVHKEKKINTDNKLVIECLRKQIAFSKLTGKPVTDLDQFSRLPRAICGEDEMPEKGVKANASNTIRSWYSDAFMSTLPQDDLSPLTAVILEGMFMINTSPLQQQHRTFGDYAKFLFTRWVIRFHNTYNATQIHVVFDHPNRHGLSIKDIERKRRDSSGCDENLPEITEDVLLPSNWQAFIANRGNKRLLVNFLSVQFLQLALNKFTDNQCHFITSGGFDEPHLIDQALGAYAGVEGGIISYPDMRSDHEESDTRIWLHAKKTGANRVILYSPDTDVLFIGLSLFEHFESKRIFVLTKDLPYDKVFIDLSALNSLIVSDYQFVGMKDIQKCILMLYICSGCDFVSFFRGFGKKTFFETFRQNVQFITSDLSSLDIGGLCAFYRLICCIYFSKYRVAFQPLKTVKEMYDDISCDDTLEKHVSLINQIREKLWVRMTSEEKMMPTADALKLHWQRSCWVFIYWQKSLLNVMDLPSIADYGWEVENQIVTITWDSNHNFQQVKKTLQWYTKGCSCKSGCTTNRCSCKRLAEKHGRDPGGYCGPGCTCQNCQNMPNVQPDIEAPLDILEESFDLELVDDDDISDEGESDSNADDLEFISDVDQSDFRQYWDTFSALTSDLI